MRLAWFGALWASGVLGLACVAGLLRWVLSSRILGLAHARPDKADPGQAAR